MVYNVILAVVGGLIVGGIVGALFSQVRASFGAMAVAGVAGGLIGYAAVTNIGLPLVLSLPVAGERVYVFWVLFGNFWGALLASLVAGPSNTKASGVR